MIVRRMAFVLVVGVIIAADTTSQAQTVEVVTKKGELVCGDQQLVSTQGAAIWLRFVSLSELEFNLNPQSVEGVFVSAPMILYVIDSTRLDFMAGQGLVPLLTLPPFEDFAVATIYGTLTVDRDLKITKIKGFYHAMASLAGVGCFTFRKFKLNRILDDGVRPFAETPPEEGHLHEEGAEAMADVLLEQFRLMIEQPFEDLSR